MKKSIRRLFAVVVVICVGTGGYFAVSSEDDRPLVVATAYPLFDALASVGGKRVHAVDLLPLDPYATLTEKKRQQLTNAALVVSFGKGIQPEVDRALENYKGPVVYALDSVSTTNQVELDVTGREELHATNKPDVRVWLDPQKMSRIARTIQASLGDLDPDGRIHYQKRAKSYGRMLADVDKEFATTLIKCRKREIVTTFPVFRYLTDRYGLRQIGVRPDVIDEDNRAELRRIIAEHKPFTIFTQELPAVDKAREILQSEDIRIAALDDLATRTDQERRGGAGYRGLMMLNLAALEQGLDCAVANE